ncbi:thioredoxin-like [Ruditapes philippinarum]|uniref:thioredoxin-like n=1 Tax=Ruditapes philippinarum TaxID=129788 RepID=UPI00295AA07F|nr:thioredoxin-like [Ruditapes philippinarum]
MRRICTKAEFQRELEYAGDRLVAVDFTAVWCKNNDNVTRKISDAMFQPEFSEVVFLQVDVDDNEDTPAFCNVDFLPTVQFYRFGQKVSEIHEDTLDNLTSVLRLHR